MSEQTPRFGIPYPSRGQDNYYDTFASMVNRLDALAFEGFDQDNQIIYGGGTIGWSNGAVVWSAPINLLSPTYGQRGSLVASSEIEANGISIPSGHLLYLDVARGATKTYEINEVTVSSQLPITRAVQPLCYHDPSTSKLVFVTGLVLADGDEVEGIGSAGGGTGADLESAFITFGSDLTLPNSRALTVSNDLTIFDYGAGGNVVLGLNDLSIDPSGTYTNATITVDAKGRVVSAVSSPVGTLPDMVSETSPLNGYHSQVAGFSLPLDNTIGVEAINFTEGSGGSLRRFTENVKTYVSTSATGSMSFNYPVRVPLDANDLLNLTGGAIYLGFSSASMTVRLEVEDTRGNRFSINLNPVVGFVKYYIPTASLAGLNLDTDSYLTMRVVVESQDVGQEVRFGHTEFYFSIFEVIGNFDIVETCSGTSGHHSTLSNVGFGSLNVLGVETETYNSAQRQYISPVRVYESTAPNGQITFNWPIKVPLDHNEVGVNNEIGAVYLGLDDTSGVSLTVGIKDTSGASFDLQPTPLLGFSKYVLDTSIISNGVFQEDSYVTVFVSVQLGATGQVVKFGHAEVYFADIAQSSSSSGGGSSSSTATPNLNLNDLGDVAFNGGQGIDNYVLTYDNSTGSWGAEPTQGAYWSETEPSIIGSDYVVSAQGHVLEIFDMGSISQNIEYTLNAGTILGTSVVENTADCGVLNTRRLF